MKFLKSLYQKLFGKKPPHPYWKCDLCGEPENLSKWVGKLLFLFCEKCEKERYEECLAYSVHRETAWLEDCREFWNDRVKDLREKSICLSGVADAEMEAASLNKEA